MGGIKLITVIRNPLERACSNHRYLSKLHAQGNKVANWGKAPPNLEDYLQTVENTHASFLDEIPLGEFERVGVTKELSEYLQLFDPNIVSAHKINTTRHEEIKINPDVIVDFIDRNQEDYALYEEALSLVERRKALALQVVD